jgi:hypothetical protein
MSASVNKVEADMAITYSGNVYINLDVNAIVERIFNIHN